MKKPTCDCCNKYVKDICFYGFVTVGVVVGNGNGYCVDLNYCPKCGKPYVEKGAKQMDSKDIVDCPLSEIVNKRTNYK